MCEEEVGGLRMVATGGTRLGGDQVSQLTNYQVSFVVDLRVLCVCVCMCVCVCGGGI